MNSPLHHPLCLAVLLWLAAAASLTALASNAGAAAAGSPDLAAARALFEARKFAEAEAVFAKLALAAPDHPGIARYRGLVACRRGEFAAGIAHLERAHALAPQNADILVDLGDAYGEGAMHAPLFSKYGLGKKCLATYQRAVALDPGHLRGRQCLFEFYRQAPGFIGGGIDKAAAEAAAILKLDPPRGHAALVTLAVQEKKFANAATHAAALKRLDAARGRAAFAEIFVAEKKFAQAFAEFEEALKIHPDDYAALHHLGRLAATTGQFTDRGLVALRRCLELPPGKDDPTHAETHWRLGQLLEAKKDRAAARAAYTAALALDPYFHPAAEALKKVR